MNTLKPYKTFEEQLEILEKRGMEIKNHESAIQALQTRNYYRLTGYAFQFRNQGENYRKNVSFDLILVLYDFDQELRRTLYKYLEDIEIYARTQIAYYFAEKYGSDGHYNSMIFINSNYHSDFLSTLDGQIQKNKDAPFVAHHITKYGGHMPIWSAVEILSFSALSKFYNNINCNGQKYIASQIGFDSSYIVNWLHCFAVLRNTCAHYGRLYNNTLRPSIKLGKKTNREHPEISNDSLFAYIIGMARFMPNDSNIFLNEVKEVIYKWADYIELGLLGFPSNWEGLIEDEILINPQAKRPITQKPLHYFSS